MIIIGRGKDRGELSGRKIVREMSSTSLLIRPAVLITAEE